MRATDVQRRRYSCPLEQGWQSGLAGGKADFGYGPAPPPFDPPLDVDTNRPSGVWAYTKGVDLTGLLGHKRRLGVPPEAEANL